MRRDLSLFLFLCGRQISVLEIRIIHPHIHTCIRLKFHRNPSYNQGANAVSWGTVVQSCCSELSADGKPGVAVAVATLTHTQGGHRAERRQEKKLAVDVTLVLIYPFGSCDS